MDSGVGNVIQDVHVKRNMFGLIKACVTKVQVRIQKSSVDLNYC